MDPTVDIGQPQMFSPWQHISFAALALPLWLHARGRACQIPEWPLCVSLPRISGSRDSRRQYSNRCQSCQFQALSPVENPNISLHLCRGISLIRPESKWNKGNNSRKFKVVYYRMINHSHFSRLKHDHSWERSVPDVCSNAWPLERKQRRRQRNLASRFQASLELVGRAETFFFWQS